MPANVRECGIMGGLFGPPDHLKCCCGGDRCKCCLGWPLSRSAQIHFTSIEESINDCTPIIQTWEFSDIFKCTGNELYPIYNNPGNAIFVRVTCDEETNTWKIEYKSYATGMIGSDPETGSWVEVAYDFTCPDCADAVDGVATGTFDFVAVQGCETSGGLVTFNVLVHADVEVQCE
jgi:hypothetical protein